MRFIPLVIAAVAAVAGGSFAPRSGAMDTGASIRLAQAGEAQGTTQQEGSKKEQLQGQGGSSINPGAAGKKGTTGSSSQRPGGTNNEESGTQSHDAQKGGSGKEGAR